MLVVLINESEGKAWKRTRRVLAKYLPQIGSRVWAGHISEEGLNNLQQDIKKVVSKAGSVTCHRMLGRNRMELQWIAGKKDYYDEQGRYAFRTVQARKEFITPEQGPYGELVYLSRCLSALLHDIGKATLAFQGKLRGLYHHEQYRHDLVGFLMLRSRFAPDGKPSDSYFLAELVQIENLWPDANELFTLPPNNPNLDAKELKYWLQHAPIFTLISWLVLTHHRLPDGLSNIEVQEKDKDSGTHVNSLNCQTKDQNQPKIKVAPKNESQIASAQAVPWQDKDWKAQTAGVAQKISDLITHYPDLTNDLQMQIGDWILANVHYNRPLLIAADHLASIQCHRSNVDHDKDKSALLEQPAYANTYKEHNQTKWGDTVPQHLRRVEKVTRKLNTLLANPEHFRTATLPADSLARTVIKADSTYYWQQLLAKTAQHNREHRPVFAAILAETGSGKTLAGVRLLDAISPKNEQGEAKLRYTLALGLRSLTLQSGEALRDQALLADEDFATLVGGLVMDCTTETQPKNLAEPPLGSENAINHDEAGYAAGGRANDAFKPEEMLWLDCLDASMKGETKRDRPAMFEVVKDWLGERGLKLLDTPVVACTVDHLVPATHATSGGDARMALRIFSSDLVLDEIDNYTTQDLITLGKLCFMAGMAGRHVVLMSATMGPFVVQGLFDAWWRGLMIKAKMDDPGFNQLTPHAVPARLLFASNLPGVEVVCHDLHTAQNPELPSRYGDYVQQVCAEIRSAHERRRNMRLLILKPLTQADNKATHLAAVVYPKILSGCYRLHQVNAQRLNGDIQVSVGFIRFNTAKQAWRYSKWLLQRNSTEDAFEYRVVCYHAKHPRLVLGLMDAKLNRLNNRKANSKWQELEELQAALAETKAAGKQQLMILVVTTTLQETGRDHDYDWAILEPRSTRGEVQAAGRVRRHRLGAYPHTNILIMSQPMRAFDVRYDAEKYKVFKLNDLLLWGKPGIETNEIAICLPAEEALQPYFDELNIAYQKGKAQRVEVAKKALPITFWQQQGFDSTLCLLAPGESTYAYDVNPIGTIEHLYNFARLNAEYDDEPDARQSLNAYLANKPDAYHLSLTKHHYTANRFRENFTKSMTIYCCYNENLDDLFQKFYQRDKDNNFYKFVNNEVTTIELSPNAIAKVFFRNIGRDVQTHFASTPKPIYKPQDALFCELNYFDDVDYLFHWALGYCAGGGK